MSKEPQKNIINNIILNSFNGTSQNFIFCWTDIFMWQSPWPACLCLCVSACSSGAQRGLTGHGDSWAAPTELIWITPAFGARLRRASLSSYRLWHHSSPPPLPSPPHAPWSGGKWETERGWAFAHLLCTCSRLGDVSETKCTLEHGQEEKREEEEKSSTPPLSVLARDGWRDNALSVVDCGWRQKQSGSEQRGEQLLLTPPPNTQPGGFKQSSWLL